jgi:hypothetical protein
MIVKTENGFHESVIDGVAVVKHATQGTEARGKSLARAEAQGLNCCLGTAITRGGWYF